MTSYIFPQGALAHVMIGLDKSLDKGIKYIEMYMSRKGSKLGLNAPTPLTHLCRVDSSTLTLRTGPFPTEKGAWLILIIYMFL